MRSHSRHHPAVSRLASSLASAARSEPELVVAVMNTGPLCVRCLAKKSGVPRARVEQVLGTMARALFIGQARFHEAADWFERALDRNANAGWYALQLAHCAGLARDFARGERAYGTDEVAETPVTTEFDDRTVQVTRSMSNIQNPPLFERSWVWPGGSSRSPAGLRH